MLVTVERLCQDLFHVTGNACEDLRGQAGAQQTAPLPHAQLSVMRIRKLVLGRSAT